MGTMTQIQVINFPVQFSGMEVEETAWYIHSSPPANPPLPPTANSGERISKERVVLVHQKERASPTCAVDNPGQWAALVQRGFLRMVEPYKLSTRTCKEALQIQEEETTLSK